MRWPKNERSTHSTGEGTNEFQLCRKSQLILNSGDDEIAAADTESLFSFLTLTLLLTEDEIVRVSE